MNDNTHGDRTGIGPQSSSDTKFRRRMRLHQSWYRKEVLRVPYGTGPNESSSTSYGNMLDAASAERGLNFLSPGIHSLARERIAEGQGAVDPFRLLRNMLTSQAMCFNLFGELALDHGLATALVRCLCGEHVRLVTSVRFEWAPDPRVEYLDDATAFDAFIEYEASDGTPGFVGVETKLTEPFSEKVYDGEKYRRWMTPDSPWRADAASEASEVARNQLWRDHLLAWSMLRHPDSKFRHGRLAVVFHGEDLDTRRVVDGYRRLLRDETTFQSLELADVVSAWRPEAGEWLSTFEERYLALSQSQASHT